MRKWILVILSALVISCNSSENKYTFMFPDNIVTCEKFCIYPDLAIFLPKFNNVKQVRYEFWDAETKFGEIQSEELEEVVDMIYSNGVLSELNVYDYDGDLEFSTKYKYNKASKLTSVTIYDNSGEQIISNIYNYSGNKLTIKRDGGETEEYVYNSFNKFSQEKNENGLKLYKYDTEGKLITASLPIGTYKYIYKDGKISQFISKNEQITFDYEDSRLISLNRTVDGERGALKYIYDESGLPTKIHIIGPNGGNDMGVVNIIVDFN